MTTKCNRKSSIHPSHTPLNVPSAAGEQPIERMHSGSARAEKQLGFTKGRSFSSSFWLGFVLLVCGVAQAQYRLTSLVSNQVGAASHDDPLIVNGWGIAHGPGPLWVSDEASGWSTLYDPTGIQKPPIVFIPLANGAGPGQPTGIVFNSSTDFQVQGARANFIFSTQDGTISAWAPTVNENLAFLTVNNSANGASYTGLAVSDNPSGNHLYAADINHAHVDMFDGAYLCQLFHRS